MATVKITVGVRDTFRIKDKVRFHLISEFFL